MGSRAGFLEGTTLLLGDIDAKGGRLAAAKTWYGIGQAIGRGTAYRYQSDLDDRVAHATDRVAAYQDADPANDPPLIGGGGGSCVYCHNKQTARRWMSGPAHDHL